MQRGLCAVLTASRLQLLDVISRGGLLGAAHCGIGATAVADAFAPRARLPGPVGPARCWLSSLVNGGADTGAAASSSTSSRSGGDGDGDGSHYASPRSSEPTEGEASPAGTSGGAASGADVPPAAAPLRSPARGPRPASPAFTSGARLVQPLRRGGDAQAAAAREGVVHINCSLNNTHVVLTDLQGQVKTYTSGGSVGFKNSGKSTPLAAERAAAELGRRALEKGFYSVSVRLKGVGRNKQVAVQALAAAGVAVTQLREVTPTPYNGCRLPRKRRV